MNEHEQYLEQLNKHWKLGLLTGIAIGICLCCTTFLITLLIRNL